jgi:hypothetical protein
LGSISIRQSSRTNKGAALPAAAYRNQLAFRKLWWIAVILLSSAGAWATPQVTAIGPDLYAYISDNDASANSTFLVGSKGILVVDTGVNTAEGGKILQAIRTVCRLPVLYVINAHYHPDHQGGNSVVGLNATIISTNFTREQTLALMQSSPQLHLQPADVPFPLAVTALGSAPHTARE